MKKVILLSDVLQAPCVFLTPRFSLNRYAARSQCIGWRNWPRRRLGHTCHHCRGDNWLFQRKTTRRFYDNNYKQRGLNEQELLEKSKHSDSAKQDTLLNHKDAEPTFHVHA